MTTQDKTMKIYLIEQNVNTGYDTYSDAIVIESNEENARKTHPNGSFDYEEEDITIEGREKQDSNYGTWCKKKYVKVTEIGVAKKEMKKGVICHSFHAG